MQRVALGEVEIDYEVMGSGEPLLLIHGAHIADAMRPLATQPALAGYQRILYHRRGFAGSTHITGPTTLEAQVNDAVGLLDHLGIDRAHVAGHSGGAVAALALASQHPARVLSLSLLEPGMPGIPGAELFVQVTDALLDRYNSGDAAGAVDAFLALVGEDIWRDTIERTVPGGVEQAEKDAATFYESELPPLKDWQFTERDAAPITCPVLSVLGTRSSPLFAASRARLHELLPQCVDADIDGATHLLQMQEPAAVAAAVQAFLTKTA